jgi:hypothetical protein
MEKLIIQIGASSDHFGGFAVNCDTISESHLQATNSI